MCNTQLVQSSVQCRELSLALRDDGHGQEGRVKREDTDVCIQLIHMAGEKETNTTL